MAYAAAVDGMSTALHSLAVHPVICMRIIHSQSRAALDGCPTLGLFFRNKCHASVGGSASRNTVCVLGRCCCVRFAWTSVPFGIVFAHGGIDELAGGI